MRVFATGTTGFLGSVVAEQLRARGDVVVALVRDPAKAELLKQAGRDVVVGDLADPDALRRGCDGCDAVRVAASLSGKHAPRSLRDGFVSYLSSSSSSSSSSSNSSE